MPLILDRELKHLRGEIVQDSMHFYDNVRERLRPPIVPTDALTHASVHHERGGHEKVDDPGCASER
jgi:hypothetical protein